MFRLRNVHRYVAPLLLATLIVACGDVVDRVEAPTATLQATVAPEASPTSAEVEIEPTDTPRPPPPTPTPQPTNTPAEVRTERETSEATATPASIGSDMVEIPAGSFILGNNNTDPNEAPEQEAELPAFMIDVFEVTNADFAAFVDDTGYVTYREQQDSPQDWRYAYGDGEANHPVVFVSFDDAQAFCEWAGKRLPTELEWEKAARGPEGYLYPWGNEYDPTMLNGKDSGVRGTTAVGSYPPNDYGLFDMAGNVKEWVDSPYVAYPGSDYQDPFYNENFRSIRGGGWFDEAELVTATNRNGGNPTITANDDLGFRCARSMNGE